MIGQIRNLNFTTKKQKPHFLYSYFKYHKKERKYHFFRIVAPFK